MILTQVFECMKFERAMDLEQAEILHDFNFFISFRL